MRKNLLVATLIGICAVSLTACSRGEDKSANQNAPTTAMSSDQQSPADANNPAAPAQPMDNASAANNQMAPSSQQPADANSQAAQAQQHAANNQAPAAAPMQQMGTTQMADSATSGNSVDTSTMPATSPSDLNQSPQATPPVTDSNTGVSTTPPGSTDNTTMPSDSSGTSGTSGSSSSGY